MMIFAPIFVKNEPLDWENGELFEAILRFLTIVAGVAGVSSHLVVTDSEAVARAARSYPGLDVRIAHALATGPATSHLGHLGRPAPSSEVLCCVDYRCASMEASVFEDAMAVHGASSDFPLVSVVETEDNPAQLRERYDVVDSGLLFLFDTPEVVAAWVAKTDFNLCAISKPFAMDWSRYPASVAENGMLVLGADGHLVGVGANHAHADQNIAWLRQEDGQTRVGWMDCSFADNVIGALPFSPSSVELVSNNGGIGLRCNEAEIGRVVPQVGDALLADLESETTFVNGFATLDFLPEKIIALAYVLEKYVAQGKFNAERMFTPDNTIWDSKNLTLSDGTKIVGRQTFPLVIEVCNAFAIGSLDQLCDLDSFLSDGRVKGFVLNEAMGLMVTSDLDVLRLSFNDISHNGEAHG